MRNLPKELEETRGQLSQTKMKLAKAKSEYIALCSGVEMLEEIVAGRQRGSKDLWNMIENIMFRGKQSFSDVKSIGELAEELTSKGE